MSMKTTMRRAICVLCLALVAGLVFALPAYADKTDPYDYTVRVFGGNDGTYDGADPYVTTVKAGDAIKLDKNAVSVDDGSKYYVKGFRVSGEDSLCSENYTVNEDTDFVVAYGVKGKMVSYTVSFVEYGTGRALTADSGVSSVTFYGKVGDKPVVPYEYITGYRPRYRNITGTLGEEGTNNWTLEYISLTTEETRTETVTTPGTTTTVGGGNAAGGNAGAGAGAAAGAAGGNAAGGAAGGNAAGGNAAGGNAAGGNAAGGNAAGGNAAGGAANPPATEEIGDVDNPLASGDEGEPKTPTTPAPEDVEDTENPTGSGIPVGLIYGVAALIVAAVAAAVIILRRRRGM